MGEEEAVALDRLSLRQIAVVASRLSVPAFIAILTAAGAIVFGSFRLGAYFRSLETQVELGDCRSQLRESAADYQRLHDLNEHKVCADYTLERKLVTVRRLRSALSQLAEHLKHTTLKLEDSDTMLPTFDVRYFGLDAIDPSMFDDDDRTLSSVRRIVETISSLNHTLDLARLFGVLPMTGGESNRRNSFETYIDNHRRVTAQVQELAGYLAERYQLPNTQDGK